MFLSNILIEFIFVFVKISKIKSLFFYIYKYKEYIIGDVIMTDLKGTKTEENLKAAFAGESQAHTKYQYFANKAAEEGYVQIHDIFMETSKTKENMLKFGLKF